MGLKKWKGTGDIFKWRNHDIFYQQAGEGEAVFLLHGFVTSSWDWHLIWKDLSQHFHLFAPDFMGFGYSAKPVDYPYSYDERAELIYDLAALHGYDEIHLIARSFNVSLAQEMILRHNEGRSPVRIKSVVLLNGRLFPWTYQIAFSQWILLSPVGKWVGPLYGKGTLRRIYAKYFGKYIKMPESLVEEYYQLVKYNQGKKVIHLLIGYWHERLQKGKVWEQALKDTEIPIQLIWGIEGQDEVGGMKTLHYYRDHIQNQYLVMLKDIGHFAPLECPEVVSDYYIRFMEGIGVLGGTNTDG
ncbi:MAG: alpha/beta hydrolase [Bacteroidia bacterium]|nr:alpha/beta hydrolase [Bacteroidia bacterium]